MAAPTEIKAIPVVFAPPPAASSSSFVGGKCMRPSVRRLS